MHRLECNFAIFITTVKFCSSHRYINGNPIPDIVNCEPNDNLMPQETMNLDLVAMHYMPPDMASGLAPVEIEADGNCFPCTVSYTRSRITQNFKCGTFDLR